MKRTQVTVPLDIPDVRVLQTEINKVGELIITIESTKEGTSCRKCGRETRKFHGYDDWMVIRHLPVFGRPSYLRYRPKRYQCMVCEGHPTTTQPLDWRESNSPHSVMYDDHLLLQLVNSTVEDVSIKEGVAYDCVLGVLERRISASVDWWQYTDLGVVGLDEIALKKGHRNFVVIVTARLADDRVVILAVLPDRQKDTLVEFLRSIPERLQQTIHTVCCDMYEGYSEAIREELNPVRIVIDRFHVARAYRDGVDDLRKQELKRLKAELPASDYQQLKGHLWALRKKPADLTLEERRILKLLFRYSPKLKQAYDLQQQLTTIFDQHISPTTAKTKIRAWIKRVARSGLRCFDTFLHTLGQWWQEIINYFANRESSGFVEGLNNKLKVLKRRCYGLFNLKHLFQRIFLDLEGYRLFAGDPYMWQNHGKSQ
jgi:transposase